MKRIGAFRGLLLASAIAAVAASMLPASPKAEYTTGQAAAAAPASTKTTSVFYSAQIVGRMRAAAASTPEGKAYRDAAMIAAGPWMWMDDEQLWELPVGPTLPRSWMVWSNGYCPACKADVPMYAWITDPFAHRFKVKCPHCGALFPTNDFEAFYRSGLDRGGVFDPRRADRSLLYNTAHPDAGDPLRSFGVDDGTGYQADGKHWRFIGAYLVYGHWKKLVVAGLKALSDAYVMTGEERYAHKAGILLDRVADLYPGFDYAQQGVVYERGGNAGYVSVWHDAVEETREIALAYDKVFEGIRQDGDLVAFLSRQARVHRLANPKTSFALVQKNIEDRILRDAIASPAKIHANFPRREAAVAIMKAILGWPSNRAEVESIIDQAAAQATAVDGVTGEKGLAGYSSYTIQGLAELLALFDRSDPGFLSRAIARTPSLARAWRFHLDTLCLGTFYPRTGDGGVFGQPVGGYVGVALPRAVSTSPSLHTFLFGLYRATGDPDYARILWTANGGTADGLPYDLASPDPAAVRAEVQRVIATAGPAYDLKSVNLRQWHLAILRSGTGSRERALWLDYDSGGGHGHYDGMSLGLFAKGKDLLPDFGYPPVQYGGWSSARALWYLATLAHNTVTVDRANQIAASGLSTLWAPGTAMQAVAAKSAVMSIATRYERAAVLVDIDDEDSYVLDVFWVGGGSEHVRSTGSLLGELRTGGMEPGPFADALLGVPAELRILGADASPDEGWWAEWDVGGGVRLRQTDFTRGASAVAAEAWVSTAAGSFSGTESAWAPRILSRRRALGRLESTFVALLEPYAGTRRLTGARRLEAVLLSGAPAPDSAVAVEVRLDTGVADLILVSDVTEPVRVESWGVTFQGRLCFLRRGSSGVERILVADASSLETGGRRLSLKTGGFVEIDLRGGSPRIVAGDPSLILGY